MLKVERREPILHDRVLCGLASLLHEPLTLTRCRSRPDAITFDTARRRRCHGRLVALSSNGAPIAERSCWLRVARLLEKEHFGADATARCQVVPGRADDGELGRSATEDAEMIDR